MSGPTYSPVAPRARRDMTEAYRRVMGKSWGDVKLTPPTEREALNLIRLLWRRHTKRLVSVRVAMPAGSKQRFTYKPKFTPQPYPWRRVKIVNGRLGTWVYGGHLNVNVNAGWHEIVHDFSHYIAYRNGFRPHSDRHLEIERDGALLVVAKHSAPIETPLTSPEQISLRTPCAHLRLL